MSKASDSKQENKIPDAIAEVFGVKGDGISVFDKPRKVITTKNKSEKPTKSVSRLAGKSLIELTKELQKVRLEKGELVMENYSEEQNGTVLTLYGKNSEEKLARLAELGKLEVELMTRIEGMKNAT